MTDDPPLRIYLNKNENTVTSKFQTGYNIEVLTPETMKLLGISNKEITKDNYSGHVPYLVLVH